MSERNTLVRSLHDLGLAAWFGGSLAGAVAVNGAAADVPDPKLRLRIVNTGWARWTPVNAIAIAAHLVGGAGLLRANRGRAATQGGVGASTVAKLVPVTRCDFYLIWPLRRALPVTCPSWLPAEEPCIFRTADLWLVQAACCRFRNSV
jgi:hypothetical protein